LVFFRRVGILEVGLGTLLTTHPENPVNHLVWYLFFAGLAAHASMVCLHFSRMWNAEHFQFFPVALIATGILAYSRRADVVRNATIPRSIVVWGGMTVVFATIFVASLLGLALTGWLSFVAFLALMVYASYGSGGLWSSLPIFIMLLVIKPLPTFLENPLTIGMQKFASLFAGSLLNILGVMHFQQGVVLVLVGKSFMAEEACSGIRSLFSSIVAIVFLGLMNRYHLLRHVLNILQTILWVVVFNAFRIAVVVYIEAAYDFSIAEGWKHELFGYVIFFVIFGTVLSTDRLLAAIVLPRNHDHVDDPETMPKRWSDALVWPGASGSAVALAAIFSVITILSIRMLFMVPDYTISFAEPLMAAEREFLPAEIEGWSVEHFRHINRPEHDLQGSDSYVWDLKKGDRRIKISLDGSFNDFHDLSWCYTALGWSCISNRFYSTIEERAKGIQLPDSELTQLDLDKLSGETGTVLFSAVDKLGDVVVPPPQFGQETTLFVKQSIVHALRFAVGQQTDAGLRATTFVAPVSTVQLVYTPTEPIKEEELKVSSEAFRRYWIGLSCH